MRSGIAKQKTSTESRRVEKGRKRSKTLLEFAAERGVSRIDFPGIMWSKHLCSSEIVF